MKLKNQRKVGSEDPKAVGPEGGGFGVFRKRGCEEGRQEREFAVEGLCLR